MSEGAVDMSAKAITGRLKLVSELRDRARARHALPDMSPQAVTRRLEAVSRLRRLCLDLAATDEQRSGR